MDDTGRDPEQPGKRRIPRLIKRLSSPESGKKCLAQDVVDGIQTDATARIAPNDRGMPVEYRCEFGGAVIDRAMTSLSVLTLGIPQTSLFSSILRLPPLMPPLSSPR